MKFSLKNSPDGMGNRIDIQVNAEQGEEISSVSTYFDEVSLAEDSLTPPEVQYERVFRQVGGFTPGQLHTVRVNATNNHGVSQFASRSWQD